MRLIAWIDAGLLGQQGHLFNWSPVFFAAGIAAFFSLRVEPSVWVLLIAALAAGVAVAVARRLPDGLRFLGYGVALVLAGVVTAGARAHFVAEPVLAFRYYGPIEGRVVKIDRSASDAVRLTLDHVVLASVSPERTPTRVRVSLHGDQGFITPEPGQTLMMTGHLSPPAGPVEPGGFDFRRMAWFNGLGAVGYTRTPVLLARPADSAGAALWIYQRRIAISRGVQARLPGETGAFAAAILTGDRSGMGQETLQDLRASNLAHLLAISGLHMGLLTAFVFGALRAALALIPGIALRKPIKKFAATGALIAAFCYYLLSGGSVATERAFIMVSVMLVAVLLDRRAISLRAVAMAALIVLALRPEALSGPGFQMSFAATTALVAVFRALRRIDFGAVPRWVRPIGTVVLSSLVAGLATAPFAAAHFNQVAHYGLLANVLVVPLMGVLVMPAAVLAALLAPFGFEQVGLWAMEWGIRWILFVADWVSTREGAVGHVVTPSASVLGLIAVGGLVVVLWQGRLRAAGVLPVITAALLWAQTDRPDLLIADSGALIGIMGPEGRVLSKPQGDGFAARAWLENDGTPVAQDVAFARDGLEIEGRVVAAHLADQKILGVRGSTALNALEDCGGASLLISNMEDAVSRSCEVIDLVRLREMGAIAGYVEGDKLRLISARDLTGDRLWNDAETRRHQLVVWR